MRTVDLVIAGSCSTAFGATAEALQSGLRVLVVLRCNDPRTARRFRRNVRRTAGTQSGEIALTTNAEVVCVDGVNGVEAIVIRYARTGRLCAVNAATFLSCDVR